MAPVPISKQGYEDLQKRLAAVKEEFEKMPAVIAEARARGDLSENAEYHAAREKQGMLKADMDRISRDIASSQVIDPAALPPGVVTFGKKIMIKDAESGQEMSYRIVGPAESSSDDGRISVTSQLARGLLGKRTGEEAVVQVPAGVKRYTVVSVEL